MINFIEEMTQDFLDYCYQTNVERAFPAIDGLKPGQRACLYEMYRKGYLHNKPHVKSAKVSGGVIADLWPHGDVSIYETFARMSQEFVNNVPLCEFHGNNGNAIIPEPASSRYTEVRLSTIGLEMFDNIKKRCVPFIKNFDETLEWPEVLPSPLPMLMINGSEGIGTTIAQKWLPYDAKEVSNAYYNYITTGKMDYTLCPSFPSGGIIINKDEAFNILKTGKGKIILRARAEINKNIIKITEICYQTCVRDLMEDFKKLFENEELPGVEDIQNMSGKKGIDIRIICDSKADPTQVLEMMYRKTDLQKSYSANQNILIGKIPTLVNTEEYFKLLYKHNDSCLVKTFEYDKKKAESRKEECEGLIIAIANIDDIITIVKRSENKNAAKAALIKKYSFTERQADCILKMTIGQLTKLDSSQIKEELASLDKTIHSLIEYLTDSNKRKSVIGQNMESILKKCNSERKTELTNITIVKEEKSTIISEDVVVLITKTGLIKRIPKKNFKTQNRNGKGVKNDDGLIISTISTNTIEYLFLFSDKGQMYKMLVNDIPEGTNSSKGTYLSSLINLEINEKIIAASAIKNKKYVLFATKNGILKKTLLEEYTKTKKSKGIAAIKLKEGDSICSVSFIDEEDLLLITKRGFSLHCASKEVPAAGRVTIGVKGIRLDENDNLVSCLPIAKDTSHIAIFSERGLGKKVSISDFPLQLRGGKGVIVYKTEISGEVIGAFTIESNEYNVLLIGQNNGICISGKEIPEVSRISAGNAMIKTNKLISVAKL